MVRAIVIIAAIMLGACPRMITDPGARYTLTVTPATASVFVQDSARFNAQLLDHGGSVVSASLSWSIDNPAVASIDTAGWVRGQAAGSATVSVSAKGETASASVVVVIDSGQTLTIAPSAMNVYVNGSQQMSATLKDRNGKTIATALQWESSNTAVATVDKNGLVKGISNGAATIEARARGLVASASITVSPVPASVVLVGAGDIATCNGSGDEATASLLDGIPGTVFTAGDNAYEDGTPSDYANCYDPSWGRHKNRTKPALGNHEYQTPNAAGYFGYFGPVGGDANTGYYSYELGAWHIIVLNSNIAMNAGSPQEAWLRSDLAAHAVKCTMAIWHHPRFSSGQHGSSTASQPLWQDLYDANADVVVVGHDHIYERFAPQTPDGQVDATRGIREFVVGTGGAAEFSFDNPAPNSVVRDNGTHGVIKFTLYSNRYDWKFVPVAGSSFTDSGTGTCH